MPELKNELRYYFLLWSQMAACTIKHRREICAQPWIKKIRRQLLYLGSPRSSNYGPLVFYFQSNHRTPKLWQANFKVLLTLFPSFLFLKFHLWLWSDQSVCSLQNTQCQFNFIQRSELLEVSTEIRRPCKHSLITNHSVGIWACCKVHHHLCKSLPLQCHYDLKTENKQNI